MACIIVTVCNIKLHIELGGIAIFENGMVLK